MHSYSSTVLVENDEVPIQTRESSEYGEVLIVWDGSMKWRRQKMQVLVSSVQECQLLPLFVSWYLMFHYDVICVHHFDQIPIFERSNGTFLLMKNSKLNAQAFAAPRCKRKMPICWILSSVVSSNLVQFLFFIFVPHSVTLSMWNIKNTSLLSRSTY